MPIRFETLVPYGDGKLKITSDSFQELHEAAARLYELDRDAVFLRSKGVERVAPDVHSDGAGNTYFGWRDADANGAGRSVTFGQNREKGSVPFFPKGEAGYYDPQAAPQPTRKGPSRPPPPDDLW